MRRLVPSVFALALLTAACATTPSVSPRAPEPQQYSQYSRFELSWMGKAQSSVRGSFVAPSGKRIEVPGFHDGEFLRVRFTPVEVGTWRYFLAFDGLPVREGTFEVTRAENHRGFVRRDPKDAHSLAFDDGTRFIALGENRFNVYDPTWNHEQLGIDAYLAYMARHGMNTIRLFVFTDCDDESRESRKQPGCLEPRVGDFDPEVGRTYDRVLEAAEKHGIYVIFTAFAIGFTPAPDTWKSWDDNPYNAKHGGPVDTGEEFLEDGRARELAKQRFEYLLARYGYSPNFLAIDLINEPEWDGELGEASYIPWGIEMAKAWEAMDPYDHLVTLGSVGLHWNITGDERPWYASEHDDWLQWHLYGENVHDVHGMASEMTRKIKETWEFGKPILCGEFGFGGEDKQLFDHTHVGIWSAVMSGASVLAHSAPPFTYDSDVPMTPERARHFLVLQQFLDRFDPRAPLVPIDTVKADGARVWGARLGDAFAAWVHAPKAGYGEPVEDAAVTFSSIADRPYTAEVFDDVSGERVASGRVVAERGTVRIALPSFRRHVVVRLAPAE